MGRDFHEQSQCARDLYAQADETLGWKVSEVSFAGPDASLTETRHCQPALYVAGMVGYSLLRERVGGEGEFGVALGLSLGELTALAAANAFDFTTGLRVVTERARLMQEACEQSDGTMASCIGGTREAVEEICGKHDVDMANLLSPGQIVISGARAKIEAAIAEAKASGLFKLIVPLNVAGAYHSRLMEPARERFGNFLKTVEIRSPRVPVFSNTTGKEVTTAEEIRDALTMQVVSPVLWEDCMRGAAATGIETFYECGPSGTLAGLAKRIDRAMKVFPVAEYADLPEAVG